MKEVFENADFYKKNQHTTIKALKDSQHTKIADIICKQLGPGPDQTKMSGLFWAKLLVGHFDGFLKYLLHLRNLLTHTLLLWHFLENLNFELKDTLEYIRTLLTSSAWLFSETTDSEHLRY